MIHNSMKIFALLLSCLLMSWAAQTEPPHSDIEACQKLVSEGKFDEARESVHKYRRKNPDDPYALLILAQLEQDMNKSLALYKEAEMLALRSGSSGADSSLAAEALFAKAELVYSAGNYSSAAEAYEQLIIHYPSSGLCARAFYKQGLIHLKVEKPDIALELFEACREMEIDDSLRALVTVGIMEAYVALNDWVDALSSAHSILEISDESSAVTPRVLEVMILAWQALGNEDNAKRFTERLLTNYPDSYQAHAIREKGKRISSTMSFSFDKQHNNSNIISDDESAHIVYEGTESLTVETDSAETQAGEQKLVFSAQASAFSERTNALKMFNNLKSAGFDVRIEMKTVGSRHWYKVLVGNYATREEANAIAERVTGVTGIKANVVMME